MTVALLLLISIPIAIGFAVLVFFAAGLAGLGGQEQYLPVALVIVLLCIIYVCFAAYQLSFGGVLSDANV